MDSLFAREIELSSVNLDAYLERVGYGGLRDPTLATLSELHRLHPAAIPFETFDVRLGLGVDLDAATVDAKLIGSGRGGYCFEHNTLFLRVLRALQFQAEPLIARSLWGRLAGEVHPRTHMCVRVHLDGQDWLADVGFGGCMLTAPILMATRASQQTRHEPARLVPIGDELRLERLIRGEWAPICDLVLAAQRPADLMAANWVISNHPASPFRQRLVVSRTHDEVRHVLVDRRLTTRRRGASAEHRELNADQLEQALTQDFGLQVLESWRPLLQELACRNSA
jgi:N-hydroxyarylamine O-acetyltransferase